MADDRVRLLIVDDEPLYIDIILACLSEDLYEFETAADGLEAWQKLEADPERYDVVLLDRVMPHMDGLEVLAKIKSHPKLESVPVILQTALAAKDDVVEGLEAGAYYYLTKPFDEKVLVSVLHTAVEDHIRYKRIQSQSAAAGGTIGLMTEGRFRFRDLDSARNLATLISQAFPDPERAVIGLSELMINAVEHGNLGITYDEKSALKDVDSWEAEVQRRASDPRYLDREVTVIFGRTDEVVSVIVVDQGDGFDWQAYAGMDPERVFDSHGRGIAMSRMVSFDALEYRGNGNEVEAAVFLNRAERRGDGALKAVS